MGENNLQLDEAEDKDGGGKCENVNVGRNENWRIWRIAGKRGKRFGKKEFEWECGSVGEGVAS